MTMQFVTAPDLESNTFMARTLGRIDLSSWISWGCYAAGFALAATPAVTQELRTGGIGVFVLLAAVAGFFIAAAAIQSHMRLSLRASTFGHPVRLVTDGVFRYSRNPIYVAFLMPLLSLAYFSPFAALVALALYMAVMTVFVIAPEETVLAGEFGSAHDAYRGKVPRWFGVL